MKKILQLLFKVTVFSIVAFIVFYIWASSTTLNEEEYSELITHEFLSKVNNDSIYSIVTYNIGYLSGMTNNKATTKSEENKELYAINLKKAVKEITNVNPDIIAFQEIDYDAARSYHINQETAIAELGYNYVAKAINWDKRYIPFPYGVPSVHFGKMVSGQSILSKYPLKEYERIVLDRVADTPFYIDAFYIERLAQVLKVTIEGKEIVVVNVHLEAFDKSTRVKQFKEVLGLFNKYKKEYPTILLGDFNSKATDENAVIQELFIMEGIGNAFFNKEKLVNTFDSKNPSERIDYIFYTEDTIEYVAGAVLSQFAQISDHLPLEMQFKLK